MWASRRRLVPLGTSFGAQPGEKQVVDGCDGSSHGWDGSMDHELVARQVEHSTRPCSATATREQLKCHIIILAGPD